MLPKQKPRKKRLSLWVVLALAVLLFAIIGLICVPPRPFLGAVLGQACPGAIYAVDTQQKQIALTIDDAPNDQPETTRQILNLLAQYQAKATFFIITDKIQALGNPPEAKDPLLVDLVQQGQEIGNHLTRDQPSIELGPRFAEEVTIAQAALKPYAPQRWLRPGGGWCNAEMVTAATKQGYQVVLGSIWPYDTFLNSPSFSVWYILQNLRPGSIIILHDAGPEGAWGKNTYQVLRQLLPMLKQKGYQVVTLSQLAQSGSPIISSK